MTTRISPETSARITSVWESVLDGIAAGEQVRQVLARYGISANAIRAYRGANAQADKDWQLAREQSADAHVDEVIGIAHSPEIDPVYARVKADIHKWAAARFNPRLYGDKQHIALDVRTVDLTNIISQANARRAALEASVLQGVSVRVDEESERVRLEDLT